MFRTSAVASQYSLDHWVQHDISRFHNDLRPIGQSDRRAVLGFHPHGAAGEFVGYVHFTLRESSDLASGLKSRTGLTVEKQRVSRQSIAFASVAVE